jgi:nucleoside-diphosphate-sugar epimerase
MSEKQVLVTGACGEIGQALVQGLAQRGGFQIITSDLAPLPESILPYVSQHFQGDMLNKTKLFYDYDFEIIYHLAAFLSSKAESMPEEAHKVNVEGTLQLLLLAAYKSEKSDQAVQFFFPSSIAAHGLPDAGTKRAVGCIREEEWLRPHTMYGANKLYCEDLGNYFSRYYGQRHLDPEPPVMLDFRALRFPGLVSAFTLPSGGTTDYGPEMLHAAAQGKPYACFVRPDTSLPFMGMPDAVKSIFLLMDAPRGTITSSVYNVSAFSQTAAQFRERAVRAFPNADIRFEPNPRRQGIVDSWPADVDDALARRDWGWQPDYDVDSFFDDYFLPEIRKLYGR